MEGSLESKAVSFSLPGGPSFQVIVGLEATDPLTLAFLRGDPSPSETLLRLMLAFVKAGDTVLDLGAHIGTFALTAAAADCRVIAVEGSPRNAALLSASAGKNGFDDRLRVVHAVAANINGTIAFSPHGPWGHVATEKTGLPALPVSAVRIENLLDDLGVPGLAFIKMDVEGSEVRVVEGMSELLRRWGDDAPPLLYESNYVGLHYYDQTPADLRKALCEVGYGFHYLIRPGMLVPAGLGHLQPEVCGEYLATTRPAVVRGWRIGSPLSAREITRLMAHECLEPQLPIFRNLLARAVANAPAEVSAYLPLRELLGWLRGDDLSDVFPRLLLRRLQSPGWRLRQGTHRWLGRLFRFLSRAG